MKIKNGLKKARNLVIRGVPFAMLAAMPFVNSCEKEQPVEKPKPHVATKEITLDFNFNENWDRLDDDTMIYYANLRDVKHVILNYVDTTNATLEFTPIQFDKKGQILDLYFSAYDNVIGQGTILVNAEGGTQLDPTSNQKGMTENMYRALKSWGYNVQVVASGRKGKKR